LLDIQQLRLSARWADRGVAIGNLDLQAQRGIAEFSGTLRQHETFYVVDASDQFRWQAAERTLAGSLQASTEQRVVNLMVRLSEPTQGELRASIAQTEDHPWSFDLDLSRFDPQLSSVESLAASLQVEGRGTAGAITGQVTIDGQHVR
jgi:hypothetical protein